MEAVTGLYCYTLYVCTRSQYAVIHRGGPTEPFTVKTGTRHECMFPLFIHWVTRQSTHNKETSNRWISGKSLVALEYADDLALLLQTIKHIQ